MLSDEPDKAGYTAAARCLADDVDALVVHLRYPTRHRRRWRSTNLLERSLGEVKRRTKVIGRFPGETSCLTLVWAVLDLYISHATNGIKFTQLERQHLKRLKYEDHEQAIPEEVPPPRLSTTGNLSRGEVTAAQGRDPAALPLSGSPGCERLSSESCDARKGRSPSVPAAGRVTLASRWQCMR